MSYRYHCLKYCTQVLYTSTCMAKRYHSTLHRTGVVEAHDIAEALPRPEATSLTTRRARVEIILHFRRAEETCGRDKSERKIVSDGSSLSKQYAVRSDIAT